MPAAAQPDPDPWRWLAGSLAGGSVAFGGVTQRTNTRDLPAWYQLPRVAQIRPKSHLLCNCTREVVHAPGKSRGWLPACIVDFQMLEAFPGGRELS